MESVTWADAGFRRNVGREMDFKPLEISLLVLAVAAAVFWRQMEAAQRLRRGTLVGCVTTLLAWCTAIAAVGLAAHVALLHLGW
jgi:hypothetical protein